ncbi:MAG: extracellular solute-binding protein [Planctomycetes bacterium]|nr:extracellular solute-binding protein [Planctomycetota bacterium]
MNRIFALPLLLTVALCHAVIADDSPSSQSKRRTDLNVAIFAYLPDASTAIEKIEDAFEQRHPSIDLDLELWNPYGDEVKDDGLKQIKKFDVIEIDACRIDQLIAGAFGGLDVIPASVRGKPDEYVGGASVLASSDAGKYVVPHWVCGNFLMFWSTNKELLAAESFDDFLKATNPSTRRPLLAAMWGSTGLGEMYADAMIDIHGQKKARDHLLELGRDSDNRVKLDSKALDALKRLASELEPANRSNLAHFYKHSYLFPRKFANSSNAALYGYSERLYYTERELQLSPGKRPPVVAPEKLVVRQFSFGRKSQGTPTWVDAFVIPNGKLAKNKAAICAFLKFVNSDSAYLAFAEPAPDLAPTYLLPAKLAAYKSEPILKKQPLLPKFLQQLDDSFPVTNSKLWKGIRTAGSKVKKHLNPE